MSALTGEQARRCRPGSPCKLHTETHQQPSHLATQFEFVPGCKLFVARPLIVPSNPSPPPSQSGTSMSSAAATFTRTALPISATTPSFINRSSPQSSRGTTPNQTGCMAPTWQVRAAAATVCSTHQQIGFEPCRWRGSPTVVALHPKPTKQANQAQNTHCDDTAPYSRHPRRYQQRERQLGRPARGKTFFGHDLQGRNRCVHAARLWGRCRRCSARQSLLFCHPQNQRDTAACKCKQAVK